MITKDSPVKARLVPVTRRIRVTEAQRKQIIKIEEQAIKRRESGQPRAQVEAWRDRQLENRQCGGRRNERQIGGSQKIIENNRRKRLSYLLRIGRNENNTKRARDKADYYTTSSTKAQRDAISRISVLTLVKSFSPIGRRGNGIELRGSKHSNSLICPTSSTS